MASTRAAIRYAKAILEIAQAKGAADAVNADMIVVEKNPKQQRRTAHLYRKSNHQSGGKRKCVVGSVCEHPCRNQKFISFVVRKQTI